MKALVIAGLNYDVTLKIDRLPEDHEKVDAAQRHEGPGGSAANTAHWLALLGICVEVHGSVGDDTWGQVCREALEKAGCNVQHVRTMPNTATRLQVILASGNAKRMIGSGGSSAMLDIPSLSEVRADSCRLVHTTTRHFGQTQSFLADARAAGAVISCELNGQHPAEFLDKTDVLFCNHDELTRAISTPDPLAWAAEATRASGSTLVITHGAQGAYFVHHGQVRFRATERVTPLDRTGGGDAFNAGFLHAMLHDLAPEACLDAGLRLARQVICGIGARPHLDL